MKDKYMNSKFEVWREGKNAKLISIILYTDKNPFVVKALRDNDIWKSLSERSGKDWAILAVKPKQGEYSFPSSRKFQV